jgi:DNA polymerase III alpha subunit
MYTDEFGQQILSHDDICNIYLTDPEAQLKRALVDKPVIFNESLELINNTEFIVYCKPEMSVKEFDEANQSQWFMPKEYVDMDIAKFILDQTNGYAELQRAGQELILFQERGLFPLLRYLKYLVDTMRANNVVWGVGRGSSIASFVLFLLGVHRINSLYYDLSIDEFLK